MPWYERAKVGDKVVCVRPFKGVGYGHEDLPDMGTVYTIREVVLCPEIGFRLDEIVNPQDLYSHNGKIEHIEPVFMAQFFRPVQTKSTESGMQVLRSILNGNPITEKQDDRKRVDA